MADSDQEELLALPPRAATLQKSAPRRGSGASCFCSQVYITEKLARPQYLAVAESWPWHDAWYVLSDEPADGKTFEEYGLRFDIEENFLDDKSNGFQLESSLIRSAEALKRVSAWC